MDPRARRLTGLATAAGLLAGAVMLASGGLFPASASARTVPASTAGSRQAEAAPVPAAANLARGLLGDTTTQALGSLAGPPATIRVYRTATKVVEVVDFRAYCKAVLPSEWIASWDPAALRAGAMAVKTYASYQVARGGKWPALGADVKDSTADQVYNPANVDSRTNAAVDATWDYTLLENGAGFELQYCSGLVAPCQGLDADNRCLTHPTRMAQWGTYYLAHDHGLTWQQIVRNYLGPVQIVGGAADVTPPSTKASALPTGWVSRDVTVALAADDTESGVSATYFRLGGGSSQRYTGAVTVSAQGETTLTYWSADSATPPNVEAGHSATIRIDKTAPKLTSDARAFYADSARITATATDVPSGTSLVTHALDGAASVAGATLSGVVTPGPHRVVFAATDRAGNRTTIGADFTVTGTSRIAGTTAYATSVAISRAAWPSVPAKPSAVVIASGKRWADALVAVGLAGTVRAPILLTDPVTLPAEVKAELARLKPSKIYFVGDALGVTDAVRRAGAVAAGLPYTATYVPRLGGPTPYATSLAVAREIARLRGTGGTVLLATDRSPWDALSAAPVAARLRAPIVLTRPGSLPSESAAVLSDVVRPERVIVLGGIQAVPAVVASSAVAAATVGNPSFDAADLQRWSGQTLYDTSSEIASRGWELFGAPVSAGVFVATGQSYPDALAGGPLAAGVSGTGVWGASWQPLLLTASAALSPQVGEFVATHKAALTRAAVLGGTVVVTPAAEVALRRSLAR